MTQPCQPARTQKGMTLIESLVCLAVTAVTLGSALPSFESARERRHLDGAAAQLETDLQHARGLAVARHHTLRIGFEAGPAGSCYVVHTGTAGECSCSGGELPVCRPGAQALRSARFDPASLVLASNVTSIVFDPIKGTITPTATLRLTGSQGRSVHLVVNIMGRVRTCSPSASTPGYPAC